jgi:hypothetical protein
MTDGDLRYQRLRDKYDAHRESSYATILLTMGDMEWLLGIVEGAQEDLGSRNEKSYNESFQ